MKYLADSSPIYLDLLFFAGLGNMHLNQCKTNQVIILATICYFLTNLNKK